MFFKKTDGATNTPSNMRKPKNIIEPNYVDDEPEVDYDEGVTLLYRETEDKNWEKVIARLDTHPHEARAWIFRRESSNPRKIRWRLLPLHASCIFRSPLAVIEALVAAYPDGAQMKDDQDMLPLHLACRNGASKGVVLTLLYAFPESLGIRDRKGRTPFDLVEASSSQNREAVIMALKKYQKEADNEGNTKGGRSTLNSSLGGGRGSSAAQPRTNEVDYEHRTILFRLVLKKEWVNAAKRAESIPDEAGTWIVTKGFHGNLRFLPLHKACVLQPPVSFIQALNDAYPDGAKSKDQDGWLPLHCACFYGAGQGIVDCLLLANSSGAHAKDDEGRMPLHYASLKAATEGVVSSLLRANPKAAVSKDDEGRLPIHHACSKGAADGVIEALLKVSPKGAQSKDDQGRLPLHHACRKKATERVVKTLLTIYPRGAQVKDDQEKLPIHYACQNGAKEEIINLLLTSYPESVDAKNGLGYTPLEEAKAVSDVKLIEAIEKFKNNQPHAQKEKETKRSAPTIENTNGNGNGQLHNTVSELSERVNFLESLLTEVSKIGDTLKTHSHQVGNPEDPDTLQQLGEKLAAMKPVVENQN